MFEATQTARELLGNEETKWVFVAALVLAGLAVGWAIGTVAAGEPVGEQSWLLLVLSCVVATILALAEDLEG
jgi:hypothetical protein